MEYKEYWKTLWSIKHDCDYEQYYDRIIFPVLQESIDNIEELKVVPIFDTRNHGLTNKYRNVCGSNLQRVWADYLIVSQQYSMDNIISPILRVEIKKPNLLKDDNGKLRYRCLLSEINNYRSKNEVQGETDLSPVILTDGIQWYGLPYQSKYDNWNDALMVKQIINIGDKVPNVDAYYFETNQEEFNDLTEKLGQYIKNIYEESQRK